MLKNMVLIQNVLKILFLTVFLIDQRKLRIQSLPSLEHVLRIVNGGRGIKRVLRRFLQGYYNWLVFNDDSVIAFRSYIEFASWLQRGDCWHNYLQHAKLGSRLWLEFFGVAREWVWQQDHFVVSQYFAYLEYWLFFFLVCDKTLIFWLEMHLA